MFANFNYLISMTAAGGFLRSLPPG